jgi:hypothetical protein
VRDATGAVVSETNPTIVRRVVSEGRWKMTDMLIGVTKERDRREASFDEFEVAGRPAREAGLQRGSYLRRVRGVVFGFVGALPEARDIRRDGAGQGRSTTAEQSPVRSLER